MSLRKFKQRLATLLAEHIRQTDEQREKLERHQQQQPYVANELMIQVLNTARRN